MLMCRLHARPGLRTNSNGTNDSLASEALAHAPRRQVAVAVAAISWRSEDMMRNRSYGTVMVMSQSK